MQRRMRGTIQVNTEKLRVLRRKHALSQRALAREADVGLDTGKLTVGEYLERWMPDRLQPLVSVVPPPRSRYP